ncbi:MAG: hypothetical protein K2G26_06075, partial [Clostridia bacterium]|nr:hypothetical protein [Clostridia bacterium]
GCKYCSYQGYDGEYSELYTEAVYSILGAKGYYDSPSLMDPKIEILETDNYGRVMYAYNESGTIAVCIMQKADENYVYYYPDFNFIRSSCFTWVDDLKEYVSNSFSNESITSLKDLNDFDKEYDESKCIKTTITRHKETLGCSKNIEKKLETLCKQYAKDNGCKGEDSVYRYSLYCTSDDYGRMLFYIYGIHRDVKGEGISPNSENMSFDLAIIFNPDWSFDTANSLLWLKDNYQNDLKEFKQLHNWNQPL